MWLQIMTMSFGVLANAPDCNPTRPAPRHWSKQGESVSVGGPTNGFLFNASRIPEDGRYVKVLPARHRARRLNFASDMLASAILKAGEEIARQRPGAILWIGNTARPYGGSLSPYSVSHQTGLDADLAFYLYDSEGNLFAPQDLLRLGDTGYSFDGKVRLAVDLQWKLIVALLNNRQVEIKYLFIHKTLKDLLFAYAKSQGVERGFLNKVDKILFQPSGGPHRDHMHIRVKCPSTNRQGACRTFTSQ